MVSLSGERSALRMAVVYRDEGYTPLSVDDAGKPVLGYALEPAIYRVRMLNDEPFAPNEQEDGPL